MGGTTIRRSDPTSIILTRYAPKSPLKAVNGGGDPVLSHDRSCDADSMTRLGLGVVEEGR